MSTEKDWFTAAAGRRITVTEIGKLLGVNRNTATTRLQDGLSSDEIITLSRHLHLNPVTALEELGKLTIDEVLSYLEQDGQLLQTADVGDLALELARRLNPPARIEELDELAVRRTHRNVSAPSDSMHDDGTVRDFDWEEPHAADSSPDEDQLREDRGEDPID